MYGGLMNDASGVSTGQRIGAISEKFKTWIILYYYLFEVIARKRASVVDSKLLFLLQTTPAYG